MAGSKSQAKEKIKSLIEKYERVKKARQIRRYDESNTRKDFIMPLFQALGWDVYNDFTDREVVEEETAIKGKVDYSFRINNIPQFLLEAKALKEDLDKLEWAKQAVTYGWNKGIPWVVLTDFESLKLFNSEWQVETPRPNLEFTYDEFLKRLDDLWFLSREGIEVGELDKQAEKWGIKAKRLKVTEKLAADLLKWRELLYKVFRPYNKDKSEEEINESVQRILDRFIFIRVCEDRQLEEKILWQALQNWKNKGRKPDNFMQELKPIFKKFNDDYNSNLFRPHLCERLDCYGEPFEKIIEDLYADIERGVKYDFSAIPADVLGTIYEQYLGYIQGKGIVNGAKRKKQGIYYTPNYIVDYIVQNTLGIALKEKSLREAENIKLLDPACGSGSFLIKAFDVLNEHIREERGQKGSTQAALRKYNILKQNIYGVDLDFQAVEIACLNLLLKALEPNFKLPMLSENIKEGNSLISEGDAKYRPFNFETEFKEVSTQGGFDVIIGNPPYIKEDTNRSAFDGLHDNPYYQGKMDIWTLFACRAIDLLKDGGYFSFIAPSSWIASAGASIFREKILNSGEIIKFVDFSDFRVFKDASIQTMIFVFQKKKPRKLYKVRYAKITSKDVKSEDVARLLASGLNKQIENTVAYEATIRLSDIGSKPIGFSNDTVTKILSKIESGSNFKLSKDDIGNGIDVLQDFVSERHLAKLKDDTIKKGDGVFVLENSFVKKMKLNNTEREYLKPYYTTKQINRYLSEQENEYKIIYADKHFREHISEFPNLKEHIDRFKKILTSAFAPYGLHRPREERFFKGKAIFLLRKTLYPAFTYVDFPCYITRAFLVLKMIGINLKYLTGLLNSRLIYFWLKYKGKKQGEQLQIDKEPLMDIPLLKANEDEQKRIATIVDTIMMRNAEFHKTPANTNKWHSLKSEIEKLERQIDQLVYKLYGLTPEEIAIVEGNHE